MVMMRTTIIIVVATSSSNFVITTTTMMIITILFISSFSITSTTTLILVACCSRRRTNQFPKSHRSIFSSQRLSHHTQQLFFLAALNEIFRFLRLDFPELVLGLDKIPDQRARRAEDVQKVARLTAGADAVVVVAARGLVEVRHGHELRQQEQVAELLARQLLHAVGGGGLVLVHDVDVAEQVRAEVVADLQLADAAEVAHAHPQPLVEAVEVLHEPLLVVVDDLAVGVGGRELGVGVAHRQHDRRRDERRDMHLAALVLVAARALAHVELADLDLVGPAPVGREDDVRALDALAGGDLQLAADRLAAVVEHHQRRAVVGREDVADADASTRVLNAAIEVGGVVLERIVAVGIEVVVVLVTEMLSWMI